MKKRIEYQFGKNGEYICERENIITDRDPGFVTLPSCTTQKPKHKSGFIPVLSSDKVTWDYFPDVSGSWFHKETKEELFIPQSDYKHDVSDYTRKKPLCDEQYCVFDSDSDSWIISDQKKAEYDKEVLRCSILRELDEIDVASLRAVRAVSTASATGEEPSAEDVKMLSEYESKVKKLREQYNTL